MGAAHTTGQWKCTSHQEGRRAEPLESKPQHPHTTVTWYKACGLNLDMLLGNQSACGFRSCRLRPTPNLQSSSHPRLMWVLRPADSAAKTKAPMDTCVMCRTGLGLAADQFPPAQCLRAIPKQPLSLQTSKMGMMVYAGCP